MTINYPNGPRKQAPIKRARKSAKLATSANRGMALEKLINAANEYYLMQNIALFTKRPTPINVVKIDYAKGARIIDAYFEKQSTTDYNGIYASRYFDFEAKSTKLKTSFPLNNIYKHQIDHLKNVALHGGIAFFIVEFTSLNEIFVIAAEHIVNFYEQNERKSIPYPVFLEKGVKIKLGFNPILDYLPAVKEIFNL